MSDSKSSQRLSHKFVHYDLYNIRIKKFLTFFVKFVSIMVNIGIQAIVYIFYSMLFH